jgi:hypothetical protein
MKLKPMSELQIASKLKAGIDFSVNTTREQNICLTVSKALGIKITTRKVDMSSAGKFRVLFF